MTNLPKGRPPSRTKRLASNAGLLILALILLVCAGAFQWLLGPSRKGGGHLWDMLGFPRTKFRGE